jgi:hypothetical protein
LVHGKGRSTPFATGAVSCFFLPCASPRRTAKIVHRVLSETTHGNATLPCKFLPCAFCRAFSGLCRAPEAHGKPQFPVVHYESKKQTLHGETYCT